MFIYTAHDTVNEIQFIKINKRKKSNLNFLVYTVNIYTYYYYYTLYI